MNRRRGIRLSAAVRLSEAGGADDSLTVVDVQPTQLTLRQVDERGVEIDRIRITKPVAGQAGVRARTGEGPSAVR